MQTDVRPYGDSGLLVALRGADPETLWRRAQRLGDRLRGLDGVVDVVATYRDVFVAVDPLRHDPAALRAAIDGVGDGPLQEPRLFRIPVRYGGEHGPDLDTVAGELGLSTDEVIEQHAATEWTIRFRAAPVAAPFLDGVTWPAPVPRMAEPRVAVPAGSVGLSGRQCIVYPVGSPGGWRLIGRTPARLADPRVEGVSRYRAGDRVRFEPADDDACPIGLLEPS